MSAKQYVDLGGITVYDEEIKNYIENNVPSNLNDLENVSISSPSNGQGLIYNSTSQEWENANLPGGGSGDYVGLYGMTEIQSSDGQGTTSINLDLYTSVGNYYCDGKGKIQIQFRKYFNYYSASTINLTSAHFLLYVIKISDNSIIQKLYIYDPSASDTSVSEYTRVAKYDTTTDTWSFEIWRVNLTTGVHSLVDFGIGLKNNSVSDVQISSPADGQVLKYNATTQKWENSAGGDSIIYLTKSQYDSITPETDQMYGITDFSPIALEVIDDSTVAINKAWSGSKVNNMLKVTSFAVDLLDWTPDTISQSGTTLYKKQITLTNVYVESPPVDIGAGTGYVLPTSAEQESYNLIQYVTVDEDVPCLYLYASEIPTTVFYIKVTGVD